MKCVLDHTKYCKLSLKLKVLSDSLLTYWHILTDYLPPIEISTLLETNIIKFRINTNSSHLAFKSLHHQFTFCLNFSILTTRYQNSNLKYNSGGVFLLPLQKGIAFDFLMFLGRTETD